MSQSTFRKPSARHVAESFSPSPQESDLCGFFAPVSAFPLIFQSLNCKSSAEQTSSAQYHLSETAERITVFKTVSRKRLKVTSHLICSGRITLFFCLLIFNVFLLRLFSNQLSQTQRSFMYDLTCQNLYYTAVIYNRLIRHILVTHCSHRIHKKVPFTHRWLDEQGLAYFV